MDCLLNNQYNTYTFIFFSDEFDNVMCQTLGKVVPEWDTDLNFRLRQLDTVLASKGAVSKSATNSNSTSDEEENTSYNR